MEKQHLQEKIQTAIWIGKSLFDRGKVSGSSANMSFLHANNIYITGSGTSFATLKTEDFSVVDLKGELIAGIKPSKELPMHQTLYSAKSNVQAIIHTHSFYATLWSCLNHDHPADVIPAFTPYLKIKVGTVGLVPYGPPGSKKLFDGFAEHINLSDAYLLKNHGPVVGDKDLLSAFYSLEELEESARIAWELRNEKVAQIMEG